MWWLMVDGGYGGGINNNKIYKTTKIKFERQGRVWWTEVTIFS